jgi:hypothetical protein
MAYAEDLVKLRKRMLDAIAAGVVGDDVKDFYEATLIQIMNEAERQRQVCVARAEDLRRQAAIADGQSAAFTQVSSIVYSVLNGYIMVAEKQRREDVDHAAELLEKKNAIDAALGTLSEEDTFEDKKKTPKRK